MLPAVPACAKSPSFDSAGAGCNYCLRFRVSNAGLEIKMKHSNYIISATGRLPLESVTHLSLLASRRINALVSNERSAQ